MNHLRSAFPDPRGMRLRYQYWESSSKGYERVAIILHGLGRRSGSYATLVPALLESGSKVYSLDFAGFGDSPGERGAGGVLAMADAVEALYRRVEAAERGMEIDLVAHSLGALAALLFLKRYPARRINLAAVAPLLFGAPLEALREALADDAELPDAFAADLGATAQALLAEPSFLEGRRAAFFGGGADPLVPPDRLAAAVEALPLSSKRLTSFPLERHDPISGERSAEVAKAIIAWFDETRTEGPAP